MRQRGCYRRKELPGGNGALALGVGISFVLILVFFLIFLQVDPLGNGEQTEDGSGDTADAGNISAANRDTAMVSPSSKEGKKLVIDGLSMTLPADWTEMNGYYYGEIGNSLAMFYYDTQMAGLGEIGEDGRVTEEMADDFFKEMAQSMSYDENVGGKVRLYTAEVVEYGGKPMTRNTLEYNFSGLGIFMEVELYYHEESGNIIIFCYGQSDNCKEDHVPEYHQMLESLE